MLLAVALRAPGDLSRIAQPAQRFPADAQHAGDRLVRLPALAREQRVEVRLEAVGDWQITHAPPPPVE
jgi:hypothetical protein